MLGIKNEIITPLETTREKLLNKYLKYKEALSNIEEDYDEYISNLNDSKTKFYNAVKDVEDFKINMENEKYNYSESSNKYKKEEDEKINQLLKIAKENQKKYVININKINSVQNDYIEKKKNYLNTMQYMEEYIGESIKDSLRKFVLYKMALIRNLQYDSENISKKFDEININKDINDFISQNSKNDLMPFKYEFVPYSSNFAKKYKYVLNTKIVKDVCDFISTIFNNDTQMQSFQVNNKNNMDAKKLAEYIFRINNINYNDKEQFYKKKIEEFFSERKKRKNLLQEMNNLRIKANIFINEFNFNNIANSLKECINYIQNDSKREKNLRENEDWAYIHFDFESTNLILIIATNLYKINEIGNKPRIFLQEKLVDIELFSNFDFWKNLIRYFIINEMHTQKNFNLFESKGNKNIQKQNAIKNVLNKYIYTMKSFEVKSKTINDIIYFFQNYYDLNPKLIENLLIKEDKIKIKGDLDEDNNYFLLENVKEGDNNFVINIPNISFKHESSINSIHNKI